ncbi:flower asymmetry transporter CYC1 [Artemisia annua]|uniref:Flower asymmetry transporter CYC1 n=1 Tax=Artemisia annua TaxID=35608 RepID=A0A2U1LAM2_ARTAN|nr:flower asymmetry transporter CYC1 [Artemisia annua]
MFSSNPFHQQVPSSIHVFQPSSFFDLENDGVYVKHQNYNSQFDTGGCVYNAPPPVVNSNIMERQHQVCKESEFQYCDDNSQLLESVIYHTKKKMVNSKKDGHSKIHTAQGPRDRRVRLSIDVSRKFFCLQDLLGFDKASKTLDWLLAKSKTAIKDLVEEMKHCSSSSAMDECEMVFLETIRKGSDEEDKHQRKKSATKFFDAKRKKMTRQYKTGVDNQWLVLIFPQPADSMISGYKISSTVMNDIYCKILEVRISSTVMNAIYCKILEVMYQLKTKSMQLIVKGSLRLKTTKVHHL